MDLVGYTALSSGLGPEATARLVACLFTEIDRAALAVTQARLLLPVLRSESHPILLPKLLS
jgi:hypothetical protein